MRSEIVKRCTTELSTICNGIGVYGKAILPYNEWLLMMEIYVYDKGEYVDNNHEYIRFHLVGELSGYRAEYPVHGFKKWAKENGFECYGLKDLGKLDITKREGTEYKYSSFELTVLGKDAVKVAKELGESIKKGDKITVSCVDWKDVAVEGSGGAFCGYMWDKEAWELHDYLSDRRNKIRNRKKVVKIV